MSFKLHPAWQLLDNVSIHSGPKIYKYASLTCIIVAKSSYSTQHCKLLLIPWMSLFRVNTFRTMTREYNSSLVFLDQQVSTTSCVLFQVNIRCFLKNGSWTWIVICVISKYRLRYVDYVIPMMTFHWNNPYVVFLNCRYQQQDREKSHNCFQVQ